MGSVDRLYLHSGGKLGRLQRGWEMDSYRNRGLGIGDDGDFGGFAILVVLVDVSECGV